jgi:penicillin-binding protein 1A
MMTRLGAKVIEMGTLASGAGYGAKLNVKDDKGATYRIPAGGKTGTSQNWSDAWAVGFTPYYTIAIWFGFDKGGNSLGMNVSGASLAGPIWGNLMHEYNQGLPRRDFPRPPGIVDAVVCRASGLRPRPECPSTISLSFLAGTVPEEYCDQHGAGAVSAAIPVWIPGRPDRFGSQSGPSYDMPTIPENLRLLLELGGTSGPENQETEPEVPSDHNPLFD